MRQQPEPTTTDAQAQAILDSMPELVGYSLAEMDATITSRPDPGVRRASIWTVTDEDGSITELSVVVLPQRPMGHALLEIRHLDPARLGASPVMISPIPSAIAALALGW